MPVKLSKSELRAKYIQMREDMPRDDANTKNATICQKVISSQVYRNSEIILIYYPVRKEIDVLPIALDALDSGKKVAFPISEPNGFKLIFKIVNSLDELQNLRYGIPEPSESAKNYLNSENALCIVPGLAFDREGYRIGYGKGYYDRFLPSFKGISVGLVYSDFLTEILPCEDTDVAVDIIISEKEELYL